MILHQWGPCVPYFSTDTDTDTVTHTYMSPDTDTEIWGANMKWINKNEVRSSLTQAQAQTLTLSLTLILTIALTLTLWFSVSQGGDRKPIKPTAKDKCPVCGMFVAKYPDFLAEILFKDGSSAFFDGTKDMFKYYLNLKKYQPSKKISDIDSIYVTDYYQLTLIDGSPAYYVLGSDIYGPMGRELIPFEKEADAKEFMKDHQGKSVLRLKEIDEKVIKTLD
jgi:copper chaperone NosL